MKKETAKLNSLNYLDEAVAGLNRDNIILLHFKYNLGFGNLLKKPALLAMWIFYLFTKNKGIDHSAYVSRFIGSEVKIFESATYGVFESDLKEKLKSFHGTCWAEDIGFPLDKKKAIEFENKYLADGYSITDAVRAGVDGWLGKKLNKLFKKKGVFCSELVARFCKDQRVEPFLHMSEADLSEMTPDDIWNLNLGEKKIIFKQ